MQKKQVEQVKKKNKIMFKDKAMKEFEALMNRDCEEIRKNMSIEELLDFGLVVLDKPSGPISHQVSSFVKDILHAKKAGHSGTLDPAVSGVLPIGINRATRLMKYLLKGGKEYIGIMHIHCDANEETIREIAKKLVGKITQLPPVRSAVKRVERVRTVYSFDILEIEGRDILFKANVEAGTYIRRMCDDFGKLLGCGAHMTQLRRTRVSMFDESQAVTLYDLKDAYYLWKTEENQELKKLILPGQCIVKDMPKIWIKESTGYYISHGGDLFVPGVAALSDTVEKNHDVALYYFNKERGISQLVAIGIASMNHNEIKRSNKGLAVKVHKVVIPQDMFEKE